MKKKIIIGNWKMNGSLLLLSELFSKIEDVNTSSDIVICPPSVMISDAIRVLSQKKISSQIYIGAQYCHHKIEGSYTGDISALMLKEIGCQYAIIGHAERRKYHGENNQSISEAIDRALENNIIPIVCLFQEDRITGEKQKDYFRSQLNEMVKNNHDMKSIIIAYEPIWAIGTNQSASIEHIANAMQNLKDLGVSKAIYGGSVNYSNSNQILEVSDGLLIGGASINPDEFKKIVQHY